MSRNFIDLDNNQKVILLSTEGEFINSISYYGYRLVLYLYEKDYFEVWYNENLNTVEKVEIAEPKRLHFFC